MTDILSLAERLRSALSKAEYVPGDSPVLPVKVAAFMDECRAMLAATPTPPAAEAPGQEPVAVKPLEWQKHNVDGTVWTSQVTVCGEYQIKFSGKKWALSLRSLLIVETESLTVAKATGQVHYAHSICSALVSAPPTYADAEAKVLAHLFSTPGGCFFLDGRNEYGTHVLPALPMNLPDEVMADLPDQAEAIMMAAEAAGFGQGDLVWAEWVWNSPQIGDEGRVELDGYWEFQAINVSLSATIRSLASPAPKEPGQ